MKHFRTTSANEERLHTFVSQSNGAAENAVREVEGMLRTWKVFVQDNLNIVMNRQARVASVACVTCGPNHHTVQGSP